MESCEKILVVDKKDTPISYKDKIEVHKNGLLHRAFSIFIFNHDGKLLIQKRATHKYHSGGLWSNTCCSHEKYGQKLSKCIHKRLLEEMGFDCELTEIFSFTYKVTFYENNMIENEYDHVFIGTYSGKVQINHNEVEDYEWINIENLNKQLKINNNKFTYWFKLSINKVLEKYKFYRRELLKKSPLYKIFDIDDIEQSQVINREVTKYYIEIEKMIGYKKLSRQKYGFYYLYPYLFKDDFENLDTILLNKLAVAMVFYLDSIIFIDRCMDDQIDIQTLELIQKNYISQKCIQILSNIFDSSSIFWKYYQKYNSEYITAITMEKENHKGNIKKYTTQETKIIMKGKAAGAKWVVAAMGILSDNVEKIEKLELTQDLYAIAFQMYDDLRDWKEDFKLKSYTWLITEIIINHNLIDNESEENLRSYLFRYNYDEMVLKKINSFCKKALMCAGISKNWIRNIKNLQLRVKKLFQDIKNIKGNIYNTM